MFREVLVDASFPYIAIILYFWRSVRVVFQLMYNFLKIMCIFKQTSLFNIVGFEKILNV